MSLTYNERSKVSEIELTFEAILAKQGLSMMDFLGESGSDAYKKVYAYLTALHAEIKRAPETKSETADKVDPDYVKAWKADETAAKKATVFVDDVTETFSQFENDPAVMFHLLVQVKEILVKYLSGENDWNEHLAEKAADTGVSVTRSAKADMAAEYQEGRKGLTNLYKLVGHSLTLPGAMVTASGKDTVPNLPALQGNYGANGGASGANAKVYRLSYNVDGTEYDDPKSALRAIFTGKDRIGKTTTNLANLLDQKAKNVYGNDKPSTFTHGGHKVIVTRKPQS